MLVWPKDLIISVAVFNLPEHLHTQLTTRLRHLLGSKVPTTQHIHDYEEGQEVFYQTWVEGTVNASFTVPPDPVPPITDLFNHGSPGVSNDRERRSVIAGTRPVRVCFRISTAPCDTQMFFKETADIGGYGRERWLQVDLDNTLSPQVSGLLVRHGPEETQLEHSHTEWRDSSAKAMQYLVNTIPSQIGINRYGKEDDTLYRARLVQALGVLVDADPEIDPFHCRQMLKGDGSDDKRDVIPWLADIEVSLMADTGQIPSSVLSLVNFEEASQSLKVRQGPCSQCQSFCKGGDGSSVTLSPSTMVGTEDTT